MTTYANPLIASPDRPLPKRIAIIGAGTIGPDIGYYLKAALPDLQLVLLDINQAAVDKAVARFGEYAAKAVARKKMSEAEAAAVQKGVVGTTDYAELKGCDWVLEAATEDLKLKRRIFAQVEALIAPDALITSNTSSLPAERVFAELKHKGRATVTHFFAPAWRNPVVEVIAAKAADPKVVAWLRWFFAHTGKVPLVTEDVACFMLDRIFDNWCNDAALALPKATAAQIDTVVTEFVHAGPFFVLNMSNGNPIITETNTLQAEEEGPHYTPAPIFPSVDRWVTTALGKTVPVSDEVRATVRDRMLGVLISQSVDILDRKIGTAADLDLGCRLALGFKRGPLDLMQSLGEAEVKRICARFATDRPGMPQPKRAIGEYSKFEANVLLDDVDGVKVITLRRPEAMNALDDRMNAEILDIIRRYENDPNTPGFVLTGYGERAFCAGGDIGRFPSMLGNAPASIEYVKACAAPLVHIDAMKKPMVAALNGMALGGGFEMAMRCHGIVAVKGAQLQLPEITLGIAPGLGAMVVPYRRWPQAAQVFHRMLLNAERLDAKRAHEAGIIDTLVDDYPGLVRAAVARVKALAAEPRRSLDAPVSVPAFEAPGPKTKVFDAEVTRIMESAIREAAGIKGLSSALAVGYRAFGDTACTEAAKKGIMAFTGGK